VILQKLRKIIYTKKYDSPEEQMESSDAFFILILFILIAVGFFIDRLMYFYWIKRRRAFPTNMEVAYHSWYTSTLLILRGGLK